MRQVRAKLQCDVPGAKRKAAWCRYQAVQAEGSKQCTRHHPRAAATPSGDRPITPHPADGRGQHRHHQANCCQETVEAVSQRSGAALGDELRQDQGVHGSPEKGDPEPVGVQPDPSHGDSPATAQGMIVSPATIARSRVAAPTVPLARATAAKSTLLPAGT